MARFSNIFQTYNSYFCQCRTMGSSESQNVQGEPYDRSRGHSRRTVHDTRIDAAVPRLFREDGIERSRPVLAVVASIFQRTVPTLAGGGQKNGVSVTTCEKHTVHTILGCPLIYGVID